MIGENVAIDFFRFGFRRNSELLLQGVPAHDVDLQRNRALFLSGMQVHEGAIDGLA